ncbi:MAG: valine--tRNA ligase [Nitrosopumilus sp.]|nr:valine--tRNA ligase [Nitrosopumilus sp.]
MIPEKAWDPGLEPGIAAGWRHGFDRSRRAYTIDTPPPYPSGRPWHIGAAAHYAQIDMIARTARMRGMNVYFPVGIDRNGLPVELYTEKKRKIRMHATPRQEFLDLCRQSLDELESEMLEVMRSLGMSCDFGNIYRTDSAEYRAVTQATFIRLWREGRVYVSTRPNNYDWKSGTVIADAEITHEERESRLVHMRFGLGEGSITIASTRPELLCACRAVIVNPGDERYAGMEGAEAVVPITGRRVPIRYHRSARPDFGSGAVMVCSYGDQNDVALFRELGLEEVAAIGPDGRMTEAAGAYAGLRPSQAREKIIADLEEAGFVEGIDEIRHMTPVSERSNNAVEIIPMEEYYVRQTDMVGDVRGASADIAFHPEKHRQILLNWLDSVGMDWPVSRRRFYGTEIPVWYCESCGMAHVPEPGEYRRPWAEEWPGGPCGCGGTKFRGEERTLDTWMDSSISPLYISGWHRDEELFRSAYPAALRPQAKDIVRTWLYYTMLRCRQLDGRTPWSEAWIMGYGLDGRGHKMSKSRGNAMDPLPVIRRIGADAFRFWSAGEAGQGDDFRCSEERMESARKFLTKLWNVSRFASGMEDPGTSGGTHTDRWILGELDALVRSCQDAYSRYDFFTVATSVREFMRNVFAAHYVEMAKQRAAGEGFDDAARDSARGTIHRVLRALLRLLAPVIPFITDGLWGRMYGGSVHSERLPEPEEGDYPPRGGLLDFNSEIWNRKKSSGLSLRDPVRAGIPAGLEGFAPDLEAMHRLEKP